MTFSIHETTN